MIHLILCFALPLLQGCSPYTEYVPSITQLVARAVWFDGRSVAVRGEVTHVYSRVYPSGYRYQAAIVCSGACVRVFQREISPVRVGDAVVVRGRFHRIVRAESYVFHNEIDITELLDHP